MGADTRRHVRKADWQALRWPVALPAMLREQGVCALPVEIIDVSVTGCRLSTGYRTRIGAWARLSVGPFAPFKARIVWSDQFHATLHFDEPIHQSVLRHLVVMGRVAD